MIAPVHADGCPAKPSPEEEANPCVCGDPPGLHPWHDVPEKYRATWSGADAPRPACTCGASKQRILVCGTRDWSGAWEDIAMHFPENGDVTIIHGAYSRIRNGLQVSVDMIADFIARGLGFSVEPYPVDHDIDGQWPSAGPRRNLRMLRLSNPNRGLAFGPRRKPDGTRTGTGHMVRIMLAKGIPVRWIESPGAKHVDLTKEK